MRTLVFLVLLFSTASSRSESALPAHEWSPAGPATTGLVPFPSSMKPAPVLPQEARPLFHAGKALANQPWVKAPTITTARDGLGPLYNVRACLGCHVNGGRGALPDSGRLVRGAVVRLAQTNPEDPGHFAPDPVYGNQLQIQSTSLADQLGVSSEALGRGADQEPPPEAKVSIEWQSHTVTYPDGSTTTLRRPQPILEQMGYGPLAAATSTTLLLAPTMHGAGLLSLIPLADRQAQADPDDVNGDGISGRLRWVQHRESGARVPGLFGWKGDSPNVEHTVAGAFANDIGITNALFPAQPCTERQTRCLQAPTGVEPGEQVELPRDLLSLATGFTAQIGVPAARPLSLDQHEAGGALFVHSGCADCHRPQWQTGISAEYPYFSNITLWPFSDLLLHDMGPWLSGGPDGDILSREWRTPPLWGVGLRKKISGSAALLHDGRASTISEAILWHGGEAESARRRFMDLNQRQRQQLIQFVESL